MTSAKNNNKVIKAWIVSELVSGAEVDKEASRLTIDEIFKYKKNVDGSIIYIGTYSKDSLNELIINTLGNEKDAEIINSIDGKLYSVALKLDNNFKLKEIFIPYSALVYKELKNNSKIDFKHIEEDQKDIKEKLESTINTLVGNSKMNNIAIFEEISEIVVKEFGIEDRYKALYGVINYKGKEPTTINSYYVNDLKKILSSSENDIILNKIINNEEVEKNRLELDKNWDLINKIVNTEKLPLGRWPSVLEFRQSLMQQTAINIIENEKDDLLTVNGPPGTGKTTLLKDVFADIMVKRAAAMVKFSKPGEAFKKIDKITTNGNKSKNVKNLGYSIYKLDESLQGYGIVVTSNNNAAVENISKDFPKKEEVQKYKEKEKENPYLDKLLKIDYFKSISDKILNKDDYSWGNFAVAMGNSYNLNNIIKVMLDKKNGLESYKSNQYDDWKTVVKNFNNTVEKIDKEKKRIKKLKIDYQDFINKLNTAKREKIHFKRLTKYKNLLEECNKLIVEANEGNTNENIFIDNDEYWTQDNKTLQLQLPGTSNQLQNLRAELFINAIAVHKTFVMDNLFKIQSAWKVFRDRDKNIYIKNGDNTTKTIKKEGLIPNEFEIMQLVAPIVSSTLASFGSMFKYFGHNTIDNVFMDESGQAIPSSAVGAIWRAKRFVAIGDPDQIPPVNTTDELLLKIISESLEVDWKFLSHDSSVQTLADGGNRYGHFKDDGNWIGIPLWVHRRCLSPMFDISNKISYDNHMIQGTFGKAKQNSKWIDVKGKATNKQYVLEQEKILKNEILDRIKKGASLNDIYVITPFSVINSKLKSNFKKNTFKNSLPDSEKAILNNWTKLNIGTVHSFQGKENKIVYYVIGEDKTGWSAIKPNMLNVAVTRAKQELYIIGDKDMLTNFENYKIASKELEQHV